MGRIGHRPSGRISAANAFYARRLSGANELRNNGMDRNYPCAPPRESARMIFLSECLLSCEVAGRRLLPLSKFRLGRRRKELRTDAYNSFQCPKAARCRRRANRSEPRHRCLAANNDNLLACFDPREGLRKVCLGGADVTVAIGRLRFVAQHAKAIACAASTALANKARNMVAFRSCRSP